MNKPITKGVYNASDWPLTHVLPVHVVEFPGQGDLHRAPAEVSLLEQLVTALSDK